MKRQPQNKPFRLVIAGGGTGGHVFPAIAIANAITPDIGREQILFVGARGKMETEKVPAAGYRILALPITGIKGRFTLSNLLLPFRLLRSVLMAMRAFRSFKPTVVTGVGGFASTPALMAARVMGIPYLIQEQNSIPGKVNRWMSKRAAMVCTAFPDMEKYFPGVPVHLTGNPVRREIAESRHLRVEGCRQFGLDPAKPVLLVVGGSQGARSINRAMAGILPTLAEQGIQVIWQTGMSFYQEALLLSKPYAEQGMIATPFIEKMAYAYGAADLVLSRAGALAIAEICLAARPSVLVPFPFAAEDHQTYNAAAMVHQGASLLLKDHELKLQLVTTLTDLLKAGSQLAVMADKAGGLAFPDADRTIANHILKTGGRTSMAATAAFPDPNEVQSVYFLGAGGIGMSGLARWFLLKGKKVHGYDKTPTPLTHALETEGMVIHYVDDPSRIPADTGLVVLTPAIPASLKERQVLEAGPVPVIKRAALLGLLSKSHTTIAIAGTHGKTSTTALVTHLLKTGGIAVTGFVGGITKNYSNNFIYTPNSTHMVVEADEFDRSFLHLRPDFSVITSTDADHLDIYHDHNQLKEAFIAFSRLSGDAQPVLAGPAVNADFGRPVLRYSADPSDVPYRAENIREVGSGAVFNLVLGHETLQEVKLGIPGRHNIENAVAAAAAARWAGVGTDALRTGLATFKGVVRRFDIRIDTGRIVYIDDYAHHPRELDACIAAVRKIWPTRKITGIFQPHLFSRTRDFMDEFAISLDKLDVLILLPIYPAREEPMEGVTSEVLFRKVSLTEKILLPKGEVTGWLKEHPAEVLITLGAGDIDTLVPEIEHMYLTQTEP
ncbi:MAG TPA: UDP-N-acetylmuramate--L-alanine ligase [Bacteroidales bacterium]|nr:UDP-N-acetylmuramate--L-alanine ligase [Bacteroidales bacterium]HRZ48280.1 UDP-N-acetylmuramate--L-alanine ligase [Bacteroidales bacterium]